MDNPADTKTVPVVVANQIATEASSIDEKERHFSNLRMYATTCLI